MRRRLLLVLALAVTLSAAGAVLLVPRLRPTAGPAPVLAPTTGSASTVDELNTAIAAARQRLDRLPKDWLTWARLGQAYVQLARVGADPTNYPRAEAALARSLELHPTDNAPALTGQGALAAARHEFADALHYGQSAVAADPFAAAGYGVVADALVELGRYDEAATAVQRMVDLRPDTGSYARAAYLNELHGQPAAARDLMRLALQAAPSPADAAFARLHLGLLAFNEGDLDTALSEVDEGFRVAPDYPPLRALHARITAAHGKMSAAVSELRPVVRALPLPEYAVTLGDLLAVSGDRAGADAQYALVRASAQLLAASGVRVDLEQTVFAADRSTLDGVPLAPGTAALARAAYAERPSVTAADALAWTLYATGEYRDALTYADQALRLGTQSADFRYHRGMIRHALGDETGARRDLADALRLNPYFHPRHATLALDTLGALS